MSEFVKWILIIVFGWLFFGWSFFLYIGVGAMVLLAVMYCYPKLFN